MRLLGLFEPLSEAQYRAWERRATIGGALGLAPLLAIWHGVLDYGVGTALFLVFLMATFGCYQGRAHERGIWMLALIFGIASIAGWALFHIMSIRDWLRGSIGALAYVLDAAGSTALLYCASRVSWTVFRENRRVGS